MPSINAVFRKYPWLAPALWVLAGWLGAQTIFPGFRLAKLEATVASHILWADQRNTLLTGLVKKDCLRARLLRSTGNSIEWDLSIAAGIPCESLVGNP